MAFTCSSASAEASSSAFLLPDVCCCPLLLVSERGIFGDETWRWRLEEEDGVEGGGCGEMDEGMRGRGGGERKRGREEGNRGPLSRISGIHLLFACGSLRFPFELRSGRL